MNLLNKIFKFNLYNFTNQTWFNYIVGWSIFPNAETKFYYSTIPFPDELLHTFYLELYNDEFIEAMEIFDDKLYYFTNKGIRELDFRQ